MGRAIKGGEALEPTPTPKQDAGPFGKATVIIHKKEDDGAVGVSVESMQSKPIEAGYIEPMQRSNPEYLTMLKNQEIEKRNTTLKQVFGVGMVGQVIGASPNSPQFQAVKLY